MNHETWVRQLTSGDLFVYANSIINHLIFSKKKPGQQPRCQQNRVIPGSLGFRIHEWMTQLIPLVFNEVSCFNSHLPEPSTSDSPYSWHLRRVSLEDNYNRVCLILRSYCEKKFSPLVLNIFSLTQLLASVTSIPVNAPKASFGGKHGDRGSEDKPPLPVIADHGVMFHTLLPNPPETFLCSRHQFPVALVRSHNMCLLTKSFLF